MDSFKNFYFQILYINKSIWTAFLIIIVYLPLWCVISNGFYWINDTFVYFKGPENRI